MVVPRFGDRIWSFVRRSDRLRESAAASRVSLADRAQSHSDRNHHVAHRLVERRFVSIGLHVVSACWNWDVANGASVSIVRSRSANDTEPRCLPHHFVGTGPVAGLGAFDTA